MTEKARDGENKTEASPATLGTAVSSTLILGVVLGFSLDAFGHRLAAMLDRFEVAGERIPATGVAAGMLLGVAIVMVVLHRDVSTDSAIRFLRSVTLLACAVLLTDPAMRILLHLLSPDFAASLPAFVLRVTFVMGAVGGLSFFLFLARLRLFPTDDDEETAA